MVATTCDRAHPTAPELPEIAISLPDPATASEGSHDIACLEVPVTVRNLRTDAIGRLAAVVVSVLSRATGVVLAENRRPNTTFVFPETTLPAGGELIAPGGACFNRSAAVEDLDALVRVEVLLLPPEGERLIVVEARVALEVAG